MFSKKISSNKQYLILNLIILFSFSIFIFISSINKKTISPSWFVDTYSPWKSENNQNRLNTFGYKHKGHDQIMQFFLIELTMRKLDMMRMNTLSIGKWVCQKILG